MKIDELLNLQTEPLEFYEAAIRNTNLPPQLEQQALAEARLRHELHAEILKLAERCRAGETVTWRDVKDLQETVAAKHGIHYGLPMPQINQDTGDEEYPFCLAGRTPLALMNGAHLRTEAAERLERSWRSRVRNSWDVVGDHAVSIVDTERGPFAVTEPLAGTRFRKLLADMQIRNDVHMEAEAEMRAMESLKTRINGNQWRLYVLNGMFAEKSDRSSVHYLFRKGRPTLACSWNGDDNGRLLAALCFHPFGYYQYSHVGCMTPTDEVIAALVMMRGDEHKFWAKSGQWSGRDPRSGL